MSTASLSQESPYDIIDVTGWRPSHEEAMGSKAKMWLTSPEDELWLFKEVRGDDERAEDWPEKVASELARVFGIPAAKVEFAERDGERGVISLSITRGMDLVHGNELLFAQDPQYEKDVPRPKSGYNLAAIRAALADCSPPLDWLESDWTPADVFVGYLVFDALIANQDRHHENWGALIDLVEGVRALAPSFDHASSLGFMLTDEERRARLTTSDQGYSVQRWAERGKSHFEGRPSLVFLAAEALTECSEAASQYWVSRARTLEASVWETILARIPRERASEPTCNFAAQIIATNRGRLLDACSGSGP